MANDNEPAGVKPLDDLEIVVIVDNETDTLSSVDAGVPQEPELAGHVRRTAPSRYHEGHECRTVFDRLCCACHGYSVLMTGHRDGDAHSVLFDVGPYPGLWLDNAQRLGIDLATIEQIFLSHWHYDHSGGLPEVVAAIGAAREIAELTPPIVDLHPERPDQRGARLPSGDMVLLAQEPTFEVIAGAGGTIAKHAEPHAVCDGFFFVSGAIERVTEYETGLPAHHSFYGERCVHDPLIMDERYVAASVRGRGVSVFSACSHAGIVNVCLAVKTAFPGLPVDLVLGGYHLAGTSVEARIEPTVRDLKTRIDPRLVAPGHCTGWRAKAMLADTFAPGRYAPSVVGTVYRLQTSSA
ncbi:MBL fold metallo-hydrolase [Arhodomonas sp. AD133]|uniref:MBL fold metallo-hydrolase n=1 Tax=Arhodomonas sp. AD133 TaxID=3415009 RepID=UPI003EBA689A